MSMHISISVSPTTLQTNLISNMTLWEVVYIYTGAGMMEYRFSAITSRSTLNICLKIIRIP